MTAILHDYRALNSSRRIALLALVASVMCGATLFLPRPARAEKWALLIGIDKYRDSSRINNLDSAGADARAMKKTLIEVAGVPEENIRLLVSDADPGREDESKPERNAILHELEQLARHAEPGDTVFVFFSGHGIEVGGTPYLLPYDADGFDSNTIADTAIDTVKFRERLQSVHAGLLFLAFDMCRNNPLKGSRDVTAENTLKTAQVRGLDFAAVTASGGAAPSTAANGPRAVVTLFSCSPDERSYEWTAKQRGYFSYFLEQGIRGAAGSTTADGVVRIDTLTQYLAQSVSTAVKRDEGKVQTPFAEIKGQMDASRTALLEPRASRVTTLLSSRGGGPLVTDPHAYIRIAVSPPDASVSIDGVAQRPVAGQIAVALKGDGTKTVEVGVEAAGFKAQVERLTLTSGTIVPLNITLSELPKPALAVATAPAPATALAASHILLTTLKGHHDWVRAASFSPDGRHIATAGDDRQVILWDAATGRQEGQFGGHTDGVFGACFSPDGRSLVTASFDKTAKVWDVASRQQRHTLSGHSDQVWSASYSPDGKFIVTCSSDNTAKVWDAATGQEVRTLAGHTNFVYAAAYSPDSRLIVTASRDGTAKVWDASTGQELFTLTGHAGPVWSASFSPDGLSIVTGSHDSTAKIWEASTGRLLRTLTGHTDWVRSVAFSPDSRFIVTGSGDGTTKIWDVSAGLLVRTLDGHAGAVWVASYSPDGRYILTGSSGAAATVWDAATGASSE